MSDSTPRFCSSCGSPLTPGTKFCTSCGVRVTAVDTAAGSGDVADSGGARQVETAAMDKVEVTDAASGGAAAEPDASSQAGESPTAVLPAGGEAMTSSLPAADAATTSALTPEDAAGSGKPAGGLAAVGLTSAAAGTAGGGAAGGGPAGGGAAGAVAGAGGTGAAGTGAAGGGGVPPLPPPGGGAGTGAAGGGGHPAGGGSNRSKVIAITLSIIAALALIALVATWALSGSSGTNTDGGSSPSARPTLSTASPTPTTPTPTPTTASPTPTATPTSASPTPTSASPTPTSASPSPTQSTATPTPVPPPGPLGCSFPQPADNLGPSDLLCYYHYAINTQNWQSACAINRAVPCAQLQQVAGTTWSNVSITPLLGGDPANPILEVTGQTNQPPSMGPNGEACTLWKLQYQLGSEPSMLGTSYFITKVTGTNSPR